MPVASEPLTPAAPRDPTQRYHLPKAVYWIGECLSDVWLEPCVLKVASHTFFCMGWYDGQTDQSFIVAQFRTPKCRKVMEGMFPEFMWLFLRNNRPFTRVSYRSHYRVGVCPFITGRKEEQDALYELLVEHVSSQEPITEEMIKRVAPHYAAKYGLLLIESLNEFLVCHEGKIMSVDHVDTFWRNFVHKDEPYVALSPDHV